MSPQHMDALETANEVRLARTQLKREIRDGRASVPSILRADLPDWLAGMRVEELLKAIPGTGKVRAGELTRLARVNPLRELRWVTTRQRHLLADALDPGRTKRREDGRPGKT